MTRLPDWNADMDRLDGDAYIDEVRARERARLGQWPDLRLPIALQTLRWTAAALEEEVKVERCQGGHCLESTQFKCHVCRGKEAFVEALDVLAASREPHSSGFQVA